VIGFLHAGSSDENAKRLEAFRKGLAAAGVVEGQNVAIEYRWASGRNAELPAMAADLIRMQVAMIVTPGSTAAAVAAKAATSTIPIVFSSGTDPVALGLVASLNRPGGNATGITSLNAELAAKRLGRFRELVPNLARYFTLVKPSSELAAPFIAELHRAASSLGLNIEVLKADTPDQIDAAFAGIPTLFSHTPGCTHYILRFGMGRGPIPTVHGVVFAILRSGVLDTRPSSLRAAVKRFNYKPAFSTSAACGSKTSACLPAPVRGAD
jgi:hypothetical protein